MERQQFGKVFISVLEEELGSRFTAEAAEALKKGFAGLVQSISKSLKYEALFVSLKKQVHSNSTSLKEPRPGAPPRHRPHQEQHRRCPPRLGRNTR